MTVSPVFEEKTKFFRATQKGVAFYGEFCYNTPIGIKIIWKEIEKNPEDQQIWHRITRKSKNGS